jgi:hypothetical protein
MRLPLIQDTMPTSVFKKNNNTRVYNLWVNGSTKLSTVNQHPLLHHFIGYIYVHKHIFDNFVTCVSQDFVSKLIYDKYYDLSSSIQLRIIKERSFREKLLIAHCDKAYSMTVFPMIRHFVL